MKINISQIKEDDNVNNKKVDLSSGKLKKEIKVSTKKEKPDIPSEKIFIKLKNIDNNDKNKHKEDCSNIILIGKNNSNSKLLKKEIAKKNNTGLILIAEDEKPLSRALEIKLSKEGYLVEVANNGEDAISIINHKEFDLIVLDLVMPKKDGFAVLEHLNKKGKKTNIIVLSNLAQEEDFEKARDLGAMTYFIKSNTPIIELIKFIKENI